MDDVTKFLLAQGVLGAFVVLETALIWYLLGEVKRLSSRLEQVQTVANRFDAFLGEVQPKDVTQEMADHDTQRRREFPRISRDK